jgi:hypothetical protein
MQHMAMAIAGLACLMISGLSIFMLAPRKGRPGAPWMEIELVAIMVSLALLITLSLGAALLITALA